MKKGQTMDFRAQDVDPQVRVLQQIQLEQGLQDTRPVIQAARTRSGDKVDLQDVAASQKRIEAGLLALTAAVQGLRDDFSNAAPPSPRWRSTRISAPVWQRSTSSLVQADDEPTTAAPEGEPEAEEPREGKAAEPAEGGEVSASRSIRSNAVSEMAFRRKVRQTVTSFAGDLEDRVEEDDNVSQADTTRRSTQYTRYTTRSIPDWGVSSSPLAVMENIFSGRLDGDGEARQSMQVSSRDAVRRSASARGLPANWPASVRVRDYHAEEMQDEVMRQNSERFSNVLLHDSNLENGSGIDQQIIHEGETSTWHAVFAIVGFFVVLHDLSVIPYALAWEIEFRGYIQVSAFCSACFWVMDTATSLCLGSLLLSCWRRGVDSSGPQRRRYMRTWFIPDIVMVSADVTCLLLESLADGVANTTGLRLIRFAKLTRLLRIGGFLRVLRILNRVQDMFEKLLSDNLRVVITIGAFFTGILWITHLSGCAWFGVGQFGYSDTAQHWIDVLVPVNGEMIPLAQAPISYQYTTSLHWAIHQLVLAGAIDFPCTNAGERIINVVWLSGGFMLGSLLVSSLSASMVEVRSRQRDRDNKLRSLRRYLRQNTVDHNIAIRVLRQATERLQARVAAGEASVAALDLLSTSLRAELHASVCRPKLIPHPLFFFFSTVDIPWLDRFCNEVAHLTFLREADDLFQPGAPASEVAVVVAGTLVYSQSPISSMVTEEVHTEVVPGTWVAEVALWCEWTHVGTATCTSVCKLLTLDTAAFAEICQQHCVLGAVVVEYCRQYHRRVTAARPPYASWPSDIFVPGTEFGDLVSSMSKSARRVIGAHAIRSFKVELLESLHRTGSTRRRWKLHVQLRRELLAEVTQGTSTVVVDACGRLTRIVSVIALHLENDDGRIFMQLGQFDGGSLAVEEAGASPVVVAVEMPGAKRREHEVADATLQRILTSKLHPLAHGVELDHLEFSPMERTSGMYEVHTKYLRTICYARLCADVSLPVCTYPGAETPAHGASSGEVFQIHHLRRSYQNMNMNWVASAGSVKEDMRLLPHFMFHLTVFFIRYQGKGTYYAWLAPHELEQLQKPSVKQALEAWLLRLVLPPDDDAPHIPEDDDEGESCSI